MENEKPAAIVFDVDGTLLPDISWFALTHDLGASVEDHVLIYAEYKAGRITYEEAKRELIDIWHATGNATKSFFQTLFSRWPLDAIALEVVADLQERYLLAIITGSMDLYAQTVASKLGIDVWYANTTLIWDDAGNLVGMDYELNQAQRKLEQFKDFCAQHNLSPTQCVVVGDSDNDFAMFDLSGRGVLIGEKPPDEYKQHAWRVIDDLRALRAVLS